MEGGMNHQAYAGSYRAALETATEELDNLFEEAKRLRNRMENIDSVITALKPLVGSAMGVPAQTLPMGSHSQEMGSEATPMKQQIDTALGLVFA
jgi:hypothetical protein